jgi:hypothetical protein
MRIIVFLGTILILTLSSCDVVIDKQGYVLDSRTNKPIENALVKHDNTRFVTDSLGYFKIRYLTGFFPDNEFEISKDNYNSQYITIDYDDNEIIYKVRKTNKGDMNKDNLNSLNFKVKEDTLYFYLTERQY